MKRFLTQCGDGSGVIRVLAVSWRIFRSALHAAYRRYSLLTLDEGLYQGAFPNLLLVTI